MECTVNEIKQVSVRVCRVRGLHTARIPIITPVPNYNIVKHIQKCISNIQFNRDILIYGSIIKAVLRRFV